MTVPTLSADATRPFWLAALLGAAVGYVLWLSLSVWAPFPIGLVAAMGLPLALLASIRAPHVGVGLLASSAALDVSGRIATIGPLRLTLYQVLALGMAFGLGWMLAKRRIRVGNSPIYAPMAALLLLAAASVIGSVDWRVGLVAFVSLTSSALLAIACVLLLDDPEKAGVVVWMTLATAAVLGVFAVLERESIMALQHPVIVLYGYGVRSRATFKDPNILASFLSMAILLALPLSFTIKRPSRRVLAWGSIALVLAGIYTTGSRGGIGGLAVGVLVILLTTKVAKRHRALMLGAAALSALAVALYLTSSRWTGGAGVVAARDDSAMARVFMGRAALQAWAANPLGWGIGSYPSVYPFFRAAQVRADLVESHTAYLTLLVELGPFGLAAFVWLLVSSSWVSLRTAWTAQDSRTRALAVGALSALMALAAQAFTYSLETSKYLWLAIGIGAAAWRMAKAAQSEESS